VPVVVAALTAPAVFDGVRIGSKPYAMPSKFHQVSIARSTPLNVIPAKAGIQ